LHQQQKRQMDQLREMREQDERLQTFKRQAEQDAEEARRKQAETAKEAARRQQEGEIASASARYSIALGDQYDVRDPYGSLSRAAMQEYAMFNRRQEEMRLEMAQEKDPEKRRLVELKRDIEGFDYMAITEDRLGGMSASIAGREGAPRAVLSWARAEAYQERARELREERGRLVEDREKQGRAAGAEPQRGADQPARPAETGKTSDTKRDDADPATKVSERKEGTTEMTDAKQAKLAKLAETEAAYAKHNAAKQDQRDRGGGGRGGR